ncbi:unnamed protein product [Symbiodinium pilosum]|uniref:Uncharacterized protein n=1 Tax=Symbiodinium pilosum TaxID=2952 RepID=A0A812L3E0_SYMPI|nr:unnamed protein product [Symbiodinium pilosum]
MRHKDLLLAFKSSRSRGAKKSGSPSLGVSKSARGESTGRADWESARAPSRSQTPIRERFLAGDDAASRVDFKDTLRPHMNRGGTFVGAHVERPELQEYLSADHGAQKPLSETLRASLRQGPTFVYSGSSTKPDAGAAYLLAENGGAADWKDVLRPTLRIGGTFVGVGQRAEASPDILPEAGETPVSLQDTLRRNLRHGSTFMRSRQREAPRDYCSIHLWSYPQ